MKKNSKAGNKPLILITNDDSVYANGIKALIEVARQFGEVVVLAPDAPRSGMSHAITVNVPLFIRKMSETDDVKIYCSNGTPADCIKLALHTFLDRKPDIILSGINHGSNSSTSIIYSGTMAAAIEGCLNGIPSIGFSLDDYKDSADFDVVMKYAPQLISKVLAEGLPDRVCLNANYPAVKPSEINGYKFCRQANGKWVEQFDKRSDPHNRTYYWLSGSFVNNEPNAQDTDEWLIKNKYIAVVPVYIDFTAHQALHFFEGWQLDSHQKSI